ncbi:hypothetical protein [Calothrix sp. PCC 6303]|uniref:hypothetical protein n=1 Tax=Calothrix sp. PCC 6303 TaxID=1170562 RepID=UPI0002A04103|nr:hypothetical protein [Calothrix sp. PCC 6303]AFZ00341.1 hypothetical protein Cal6303_1281 [Calothrix sp. PCC 6303]
MLIVVVTFNMLLSFVLLYLAWRILLLKQKITNINNILVIAERNTSAVLRIAPSFIMIRQQNIANLRQVNQMLELQIYQIRQLFGLFVLALQVWQNIQRNFRFQVLAK